MGDFYRSYAELEQHEKVNEDYEILAVTEDRDPRIVVVAPHGGKIEPHTSTIARRIAGDEFVLYALQGKKGKHNARLHITSHRFDEPQGDELARNAAVVFAVHGMAGDDESVMVGGRHEGLVVAVRESLSRLGIRTPIPPDHLAGRELANICNRSKRRGVQIEMSAQLRDALRKDTRRLARFADEMQSVLREEVGGAIPGARGGHV